MLVKHLAIILDGNGRWAKMHNLHKSEGHRMGAEVAIEIIQSAYNLGIAHLTLYVFSHENWNRPEDEVLNIISLFESYLRNNISGLRDYEIKFKLIGNRDKLEANIIDLIEVIENKTKNHKKMNLYCAFSYGGRDEIIRACNKIISSKKYDSIDENIMALYLDDPEMPDVDLMIRTGGDYRISNFLLWKSAYSELYFSEKFWPDFVSDDLVNALEEFKKRKRNFGYSRE